MVVRAKSGTSISAAISAAPIRKLTTTEPQAGRSRSAPRGSSGSLARRRCTTNATAAIAAPSRYHRPWSEKTCTLGSAVAKARITPPRATARYVAPVTSASRSERPHARRSTSGRRAVRVRATSSSASTTVAAPTGVSHRLPPSTNGMNSRP